MAEGHVLEGECSCPEREAHAGTFFYLPTREGWVFEDSKPRSLTRGASYWKDERYVDDHTGEPFVFHVCPWCGHDLPVWPSSHQADGGPT